MFACTQVRDLYELWDDDFWHFGVYFFCYFHVYDNNFIKLVLRGIQWLYMYVWIFSFGFIWKQVSIQLIGLFRYIFIYTLYKFIRDTLIMALL